MKDEFLQKIKQTLDVETLDFDGQWSKVQSLIEDNNLNRSEVNRWILTQYIGYVEQRGRAGVEFVRSNPEFGWIELQRLASSEDPDDRDTALYVLAKLNDPRGKEIAIRLLNDEWPYIQFEAVDILKTSHPLAVIPVLRRLQKHEQNWVREMASAVLKDMDET